VPEIIVRVFMVCAVCGEDASASICETKKSEEYCEYFCGKCYWNVRRPPSLARRMSLRNTRSKM
jgi:hypothetical protein